MLPIPLTRRQFLQRFGAAGLLLACERWLAGQELRPIGSGRLLGTMPLGRFAGPPPPPLNTLLDSGLDARLFTDLSALDSSRLTTPTSQFYVRTAHPPMLPPAEEWRITLAGLVDEERTVGLNVLSRDVRAMGARVMECSGNTDPSNFGLLSAAEWDGVPVVAVLDRAAPRAEGRRVRITGVDDERTATATSIPGASWVFTRDELERTGAFLAFRMNGAPLIADHGAPIRLLVPNYYGCCCIKWVSRIDYVGDDEPATSQMREFAARTHQSGIPRLAREYEPPMIDLAAMPVRVEQWAVNEAGRDRLVYRVVGVRWGGGVRTAPLTIRFRHTEPFVPVTDNPSSDNPATWSLWSHQWMPDAPGRYQIALRVADPSIRTRRLDLFFYTREVEVDRA